MKKIKRDPMPDFLVWNRVKLARKERGLTQPQVAVAAGISISTLWAIESGYERKTTKETKRKLGKFFKCDVDDIFPAEMIGNKTRVEIFKEAISKLK